MINKCEWCGRVVEGEVVGGEVGEVGDDEVVGGVGLSLIHI